MQPPARAALQQPVEQREEHSLRAVFEDRPRQLVVDPLERLRGTRQQPGWGPRRACKVNLACQQHRLELLRGLEAERPAGKLEQPRAEILKLHTDPARTAWASSTSIGMPMARPGRSGVMPASADRRGDPR